MPSTLRRLLPVAAIALALVVDACRFGYGSVTVAVGGQASAGDSGASANASGNAGFATNAGSDSGGAADGGMAGVSDDAGASASAGAGAGGVTSGAGGTAGAAGRSGSGGTAGAAGRGGAGGSGAGSGGSGGVDLVNLVVTTGVDEADAGATPGSPGQTGFSLREAISFANGNAGHQSITFDAAVATVALKSALPSVQETLDIKGLVVIDATGNAATSACLSVAASDVHIDALEIHHCQGEPVLFSSSTSSGNQLTNSFLHDNKKAVVVYGDGAIISGNLITFSAVAGLEIFGKNAQLQGNDVAASLASNYLIHDGANGAYLLANVSIGGGDGIALGAVTGATIWHSTIVDSVFAGLNVGTATLVDARNNIFSGADTYGVRGPDSAFSALTNNLYFNNTSGNRNQGSLDAASVVGDPLFNNPASFDYALKTGSPAINRGVNLGVDRNGSTAGLYNGSAPDIGWLESP